MWAVLASGQSLTQEDVNYCLDARDDGRLKGIIAVSNVGLDLCPSADALVSHDGIWWALNPQAMEFKGDKYCKNTRAGIKTFIPFFNRGCNSGLMAMDVAHRVYGAKKILLLGFDMHGTHYFGKHPDGLKNTTEKRFSEHIAQFNLWRGCDIVNCTPNSALRRFPMMDLRDAL